MKPVIIYRHPEGRGVIVADPVHHRLIVSSADEASTVAVTIGPDGLKALADKLRELADVMEAAQ